MGKLDHWAASIIRSRTGIDKHEIAVILGSGWGHSIDELGVSHASLLADEIPGFRQSGVVGHQSKVWSIRLRNGLNTLVIGARTHLYENHGVDAVVHPVRTAAACGARTIVLTNGAGGIREGFSPGQAVLISDHINLSGVSPIEGPKFVDLTDLYSKRLRLLAREIQPRMKEGIYVQFRGPQYETPAEVQMAKTLGGDLVGMSTALEAIAAREAGMEVLGLSLITNLAAGIAQRALSHEEVIETGKSAGKEIGNLMSGILEAL